MVGLVLPTRCPAGTIPLAARGLAAVPARAGPGGHGGRREPSRPQATRTRSASPISHLMRLCEVAGVLSPSLLYSDKSSHRRYRRRLTRRSIISIGCDQGIATCCFRDGCGDAITAREQGDLKPGPAYARLRAVVQTDGCEG
jgi:hypothetical protein